MDKEDFIEMFEVAFPERPKDRIEKLALQLANSEGKISKQHLSPSFHGTLISY